LLVDDIRQCGSLSNYSADFYEASHKLFKHTFNQTSRRSISGQSEALARLARKQGENDAAAIRMGITENSMRSRVVDQLMGERKKKSQRLTRSKGDSIRVDTANLCGGGNKMEWYKICAHAATCHGSSDHVQIAAAHEISLPVAECRGTQELCDDVGGPGRLKWHVARIQELFDPPSSAVVRRPVSANAAGLPFPTLLGGQPQSEPGRGTVDGRDVVLCENGDRELQRVVSWHAYYGSAHPRQDNVMIEVGSDADPDSPKDGSRANKATI
jgi:hypothetical protein